MTTLEKARETVRLAARKEEYDKLIARMDGGREIEIFLDGVNRTSNLLDAYPNQSWIDLNNFLRDEFQVQANDLQAQIDAIWA